MKKILSVFLSLLLLLSLSAPALAADGETVTLWRAELSGFELNMPEAYRQARGGVELYDAGEGYTPGKGIVSAYVNYIAMGEDDYNALGKRQSEAFLSGDLEKLAALNEQLDGKILRLFDIYGISGGRGEPELREWVMSQNLDPVYYEGEPELLELYTALYSSMKFTEIGEKGGWRYYLCSFAPEALMTVVSPEKAGEDFWREFLSLLEDESLILDNIRLTGSVQAEPCAEPEREAGVLEAPYAGFRFEMPEAYGELRGSLSWSGGGPMSGDDLGIVQVSMLYYAVPEEDWDAYVSYTEKRIDALLSGGETPQAPNPAWESSYEGSYVFEVFGIDGGRGLTELLPFLEENNGWRGTDFRSLERIGREGGTTFYLAQYAELDDEDEQFRRAMGPLYDEFAALCADKELFLSAMTLSEPVPFTLDEAPAEDTAETPAEAPAEVPAEAPVEDTAEAPAEAPAETPVEDTAEAPAETGVSFQVMDLEGRELDGAELFAGHKVTMLYVWTTWCATCRNELRELELLSHELEERDCQLVGVCLDGGTAAEQARSILSRYGVSYPNLVWSAEMPLQLFTRSVPASFFADSEGHILTEPIVGSHPEQYLAGLEEALALVE